MKCSQCHNNVRIVSCIIAVKFLLKCHSRQILATKSLDPAPMFTSAITGEGDGQIAGVLNTDRQTDRQTERDTETQTDRQTDRQTERETERHREGQTVIPLELFSFLMKASMD